LSDHISVKIDFSTIKIDIDKIQADMRIKIDSPLILDKLNQTVGDPENINLQLIDNNNNNTLNIPGSRFC
jgi:hypothetical protein